MLEGYQISTHPQAQPGESWVELKNWHSGERLRERSAREKIRENKKPREPSGKRRRKKITEKKESENYLPTRVKQRTMLCVRSNREGWGLRQTGEFRPWNGNNSGPGKYYHLQRQAQVLPGFFHFQSRNRYFYVKNLIFLNIGK